MAPAPSDNVTSSLESQAAGGSHFQATSWDSPPANTSYLQTHQEPIILLSVLLRLVLYIRSDGEVRLTPDCRSLRDQQGNSIGMLMACEGSPSSDSPRKKCLLASQSKRHILVMERSTGRLATIQSPTDKPTNDNSASICPWFELTKTSIAFGVGSLSSPVRRLLVIGCPDNERHQLMLHGEKLRHDTDCEAAANRVYSQVPKTSTLITGRKQGHFAAVPEHETWTKGNGNLCLSADKFRARCDSNYRYSYPLNWMPWSPCMNDVSDAVNTTPTE